MLPDRCVAVWLVCLQVSVVQSCIESMMDEFTEDTIPVEELQVRHGVLELHTSHIVCRCWGIQPGAHTGHSIFEPYRHATHCTAFGTAWRCTACAELRSVLLYCVCVLVLQLRLDQSGLSLTEASLIEFLKFCSNNYDKPEHQGKLPALLYIEDTKSFVVCA